MNRGPKSWFILLLGAMLICTSAAAAVAQTNQGIMFSVKEGSGFSNSDFVGKRYWYRGTEVWDFPTASRFACVQEGNVYFDTIDTWSASLTLFCSNAVPPSTGADTGTYSVADDGSFTFTTEGGTGPTLQGKISSDASFVMLYRADDLSGGVNQLVGIGVEQDTGLAFSNADLSGDYKLSLLGLSVFQTDNREATIVDAAFTCTGTGNWSATFTAVNSSGVAENGSTAGTYSVDTDGRFVFYEDSDELFQGNINKDKDKLIITQALGTSVDDVEQGLAVAHWIDPGRTYALSDAFGAYAFRMIQVHDIESPPVMEYQVITGEAAFDGVGGWTTSGVTVHDDDGSSAALPPAALPYGTYTIDPDGTMTLTPTHPGASPEEIWTGSYAADTQSVVFTTATVLGTFSITAGVMNVHRPDDTYQTYLAVDIGPDFTGSLPDDIDSITVVGPSGPLPLTMADFEYYPQWREFFAVLPGSPEIGQYEFTVTSGTDTGTAVDFQNVNLSIPVPDPLQRSPADGATVPTTTPQFCWGEVSLPPTTLYYRLEITDLAGNRVYATSRQQGMLCHTPPSGTLTPGESYQWRVRVLDADNWVGVQNRSHSDWFTFTVQAGVPFGIIGSVMNVHQSDDSFATYFEVEIGGDFTGILPGDIDSITITGPGGVLPINKDDFTYNPTWKSFFVALPGSPAMGQYDFTATSGTSTGTAVDFQNVNLSIPIPDPALRSPADGATAPSTTPQFCWGEISLPATTLYYRLEITDLAGNRVYATSRQQGMLCHTPPPGTLTPGETYQWRVRVTDSDNWVVVQNRANSSWFFFTVSADAFSISGSVMHVRTPDDLHQTYLLVVIGPDFTGILPDDIDTVTVEGPSGPLPLTKNDFDYEEQWTDFFTTLDGAPEVGTYTFTVTSGTAVATATDVQGPILDIPLIDQAGMTPMEGEIVSSATPTFCWPAVSLPGITLYYRLQILDLAGNEVYSSARVEGMLCHTVPSGFLIPGRTYKWRVRVTDASDWIAVNNRAHSDWFEVAMEGIDSQGILIGVREDSGCSAATLAGKRFYFRMLELNHEPTTYGHRASVMHGYVDTEAGGDSIMTIWWHRSDGTSSGAVPVVDTGTYSVNADCTFAMTTEGGAGPTLEGAISADGSFMTFSRCETVGGETVQFLYAGVERDPVQAFVPGDISGTYHLHLLNASAFETAVREANVVNATFDCDGAGSCRVTYESVDSSGRQETGSVPVTYEVQGDGSFTFTAGTEALFSGYISEDKDQLIVYQAAGATAADVELAIGTAYRVDPAKTYTAADLNGSYRIRLMQMHGVEDPVMENQVINATVAFDGSGNWNASEAWLCNNDGTAGDAPPVDLPFGTYTVDPDGTVMLIPTHPGATPGEMWKGSYSPDARTIAFAMPAAVGLFSMEASVMNVHRPDDTVHTYLSIEIGSDFADTLPDDIDEITIERPGGLPPLTKADLLYDPLWREFFLVLPGSPEIGTYEFAVTSGITTANATDFQGVNLALPIPDSATFSHQDGEIISTTTPTFSWGAVDLPPGAPLGTLLHYRLEISDLSYNRVYASSRLANMLSHTVPDGQLVIGESYYWRVRVTDADNWVGVQNRSYSDWLMFTVFDTVLSVSVPPGATEGDGLLAGAGSVSLTNTLPFDLVVTLSSSDTSELTVPAQVVIPQGSLAATFDVTIADDALIDGTQSVTVTATAQGLEADAAMDVFDNDDTDGDGMDDGWERFHFEDSLDRDGTGDFDDDQLIDLIEYQILTNPTTPFSDEDLMPDGWEARYSLDPNDPTDADEDADGDGLTNENEYLIGSNPRNVRPDPPTLISPADGATGQPLSGLQMETDVYSDPELDPHILTEWQISTVSGDFSDGVLAFQASTDLALTELLVPETNLSGSETYFWRVRFTDEENNPSVWSEEWSFTMEPSSDGDGNGIPDSIELPPGDPTDLNENGIPDVDEPVIPTWKCFQAAVGGEVAVAVPAGSVINAVEAIDSATINDIVNRPDNLPWGLVGFNVTVPNPGDSIDITIKLSGPPPAIPAWYLWSAAGGWVVVPATITETADGNTQVVFTKTDGGFGDADGLANGTIVDPVGLAAQQPAQNGSGGGGGGCFVYSAENRTASQPEIIRRGALWIVLVAAGMALVGSHRKKRW